MKLKVGHKLLAIREERRLTQADISDILDIPLSTYARIERNETSVSIEKLTTFSKKLQVPVHDLLPETVSITNNSSNSGQGGGVVFGNQYFYLGSDLQNQVLKEKEILENKVRELEQKVSNLMKKLIEK